jgi:hypothetical protein
MHPSLRRLGAGLFVAVLVAGVAPVDAAAASTPARSTISFTGGVLAPMACSSTPDPATLTVPNNSRVVLANFTGAAATVDVGTGKAVAVPDGSAVSVKFKKGEHQVRMVPDCPGTLQVEAAVVTVVKPADADAGPDPDLGGAPPGPDPSRSPPALSGVEASPGPATGLDASSGPIGVAGAGGSDAGPADDGALVLAVAPAGERPDGRGARLLAVIATICVFGVTTAIIRAIVAQRTTRSSGTSQHE